MVEKKGGENSFLVVSTAGIITVKTDREAYVSCLTIIESWTSSQNVPANGV